MEKFSHCPCDAETVKSACSSPDFIHDNQTVLCGMVQNVSSLFQDKVDTALEKLRKEVPGQVNVPPERIFLGFDAYRQVLALDDVNLVMLLTPPGFRPEMVAAGVEAGKHLFVEKPGAVDPVGVRALIEASERAAEKGLSLVVGTQQRYAPQYLELIQKIRDGQIGELTHLKRQPKRNRPG